MPLMLTILQVGGAVRASVPALVAGSGPFAKAILLLLLVISMYSWAVMIERIRLYNRTQRANRAFIAAFQALPSGADTRLMCEQHPASLFARVALAGQKALDQHPTDAGASTTQRYEFGQRAMERTTNVEAAGLEKHVGFLATAGSVSPFIGLMGTVWGVMSAFLNIGAQGSASLVVVAPGIAEALIATVAGLAAAIPAVVGYNHLLGRLRELTDSTSQFAAEYLDRRLGGPVR